MKSDEILNAVAGYLHFKYCPCNVAWEKVRDDFPQEAAKFVDDAKAVIVLAEGAELPCGG